MKATILSRFNTILLFSFAALICSNHVQANNDKPLDRALISSLASKDYAAAERLLKKGANPEAIFGHRLKDNAVCTAIDDRSDKYLKLLMKYGASANAHWDVEHELRRTPLVCSVYLLNFEAFDHLLENGADPSVDLYEQTDERYFNSTSAFTVAISSRTYPMALRLLQLYPIFPAELSRLVYDLENSSYQESHPWNPARNELIKWARQRVPTLNPKLASPRTGLEPDCLFTFRDHEEGLKKGTVCWDTEDN